MMQRIACALRVHHCRDGSIQTKILRVMRITAFLMLMGCLHVSAGTFSQTVTYTGRNVPLEEVFTAVEKQTGYLIFCNKNMLEHAVDVTISVRETSLKEFLDKLTAERGWQYTITNKNILIRPAEVWRVMDTSRVGGIVIDMMGKPLAGASVKIAGTRKGTITRPDGTFSLDAVPGDQLVVSFIGYAETTLPAERHMSIQLQAGDNKLEEVTINAGYYRVTDREKTGNISRVDAKTIEQQPVGNPLQALQGRVPGVYIQQMSGIPGTAFNISIRGQNSLRNTSDDNGNLPLYVVDGVPMTASSLNASMLTSTMAYGNPMIGIEPSDVESIEILKDADATSIYGSRGANGVVLITTKRGKAGKTKLEMEAYTGISEVARKMEMLGTSEYLGMRREAFKNEGVTDITDGYGKYDITRWDPDRYTDWQEVLIGKTARQSNAQLSISGGNANTQFLVGGGHFWQSYVYPGEAAFGRTSVHLNMNHTSDNQRFRMNITAMYTNSVNNLNSDYTLMALSLAPNAPALYMEDGELNWENSTWSNPLALLRKTYLNKTDNLNTSGTFSYRILKGLEFKAMVGYTAMQAKERTATPIASEDPAYHAFTKGRAAFSQNNIKTWITEPQLSYDRMIGDGRLQVILGGTLQNSEQQGETISATGYTSDALLENVQAAGSTSVFGSNYYQYRHAAIFSRINYNLSEKYILNVTVRRDGSSRFGPDRQLGNFGAVGAAWLFYSESFIRESIPFLSYGKLRGSYGTTGSDAISNYQYLNTYRSTVGTYNGSGGLAISRLNNPSYSWETNKKMEASIELGFLKNRILTTATWYRNRSSNQLVGLPLPVITGQASVQFNLPATVENRGWEMEMRSTNINGRTFQWNTSLNFTIPRNKLVAFPNLEAFPIYKERYQVGKSLYIRKTLKYLGVNPQTGGYMFEDLNGDGNFTHKDDGMFLKEIAQRWYGGVNNSFSYKGITLDIFFQFVKQTSPDFDLSYGFMAGAMANQPLYVTDRWQKPGDQTNQMAYFANFNPISASYDQARASDKSIVDGSFVKLRNASLNWDVPAAIAGKAGMKNARIYIIGQNLLTFTNFVGFDPENANANNLPPLRTITAGIQVSL